MKFGFGFPLCTGTIAIICKTKKFFYGPDGNGRPSGNTAVKSLVLETAGQELHIRPR